MPVSRFAAALTAVAVAAMLSACGGNSPAGPSPTPTPTPAPTPTPPIVLNGSPRITSMSAIPGFGIATLTTFSMTAAATDPDGDPLTFDWELGDGTRLSGTSIVKSYLTGGAVTVTLTVTDGRGGSATDQRTISVGSLTGGWSGNIGFPGGRNVPATLELVQVGGVVTGTLSAQGDTGRTDPSQLGRIDSQGAFEIRWKIDPFIDFTMRGRMEATGLRISGGTFGSGFNGEPFVFDKR
jgi:hypothetical protein